MQLDPATSLAARAAPAIRSVAGRDGSMLVLPVGSCEQHGEHLPIGTDSLLAEAVAHAGVAAAAASDDADGDASGSDAKGDDASGSDAEGPNIPALVAPAVWTGYSPHHLPFGATLSTGFGRLRGLLEDLAGSGLGGGFDAVVLVNGHGGNTAVLEGAVGEIGVAHPDAEVVGVTYFELAAGLIDDIRQSDTGGMAHGGEFETSLMQHLHPELVGDDRPATPLSPPYERAGRDLLEAGPVSAYRGFDELSESGAIGEPDLASAEAGEALFELLAAELGSLLAAVHETAR